MVAEDGGAVCGDVVPEAPYSLERLIDSYDTIKEAEVKIALLMSTMKLFFVRPPEVQRMLGRLLKKATEDVSSQDLHDRALLYYRLLRTSSVDVDPSVVRDVVSTDCNLPISFNFSEEEIDDDIRDELMKEFNSLSIVYGTTGESFIAEEFQVKFVRMPAEHCGASERWEGRGVRREDGADGRAERSLAVEMERDPAFRIGLF